MYVSFMFWWVALNTSRTEIFSFFTLMHNMHNYFIFFKKLNPKHSDRYHGLLRIFLLISNYFDTSSCVYVRIYTQDDKSYSTRNTPLLEYKMNKLWLLSTVQERLHTFLWNLYSKSNFWFLSCFFFFFLFSVVWHFFLLSSLISITCGI